MIEEMRAHGHRSLELYLLFPLQMTIQRLIAYEADQRDRYGPVLTAFFGTDTWLPLAEAPRTEAQGAVFRQALTDLYISRLRKLWRVVAEQRTVKLTGSREFYRMIYASDHPVGDRIAGWERDDRRKDQMGFDF